MVTEFKSKLQAWIEEASDENVLRLEDWSQSIRNLFYQWIKGIRHMSPQKAAIVSDAMLRIKEFDKSAPTPLDRGELCEVCHDCPHYKAHKKSPI